MKYRLTDERGTFPAWAQLLAGAGSRGIALVATYPYQLLRSVLQQQNCPYNGVVHAAQHVCTPLSNPTQREDGVCEEEEKEEEEEEANCCVTAASAFYFRSKARPTIHQIVRTEGMRGLYKGIGLNLTRSIPPAACMFLLLEQFRLAIGSSSRNGV
jgi:hypothetical protein